MDMQQLVDNMSAEQQSMRKESDQFTLGDLIERLEQLPEYIVIPLGQPMSYRGYYCDLAFELSSSEFNTVKEILEHANYSVDRRFTGYKGGDFVMDLDTPVWIAHYGSCGRKITGITDDGQILSKDDD
jgi:hypothetical protein